MEFHDEEWGRKGATLSDKTARSEFGLTQEEIIEAIDAGKLQYRPASMHGNPWLRLLRREVEELVRSRQGQQYLRERQARTGQRCLGGLRLWVIRAMGRAASHGRPVSSHFIPSQHGAFRRCGSKLANSASFDPQRSI
jgi:hypothetical protein